MKSQIPNRCRRHFPGFTLVEMLVVIAIVAVLAVLSLTLLNRARFSAAKANSLNQMRNIHVAIYTYMAEKSWTEPFHVATSLADFPNESSVGSITTDRYIVGNHARALYNYDEPENGYLKNPADFFSPLVKNTAPAIGKYDPNNASSSNIWGTYAWFHPWKLNARNGLSTVNPKIDGKFLMATWYDPTQGPKFEARIYHALMLDGSVITAAENQKAFNAWIGLP